MSKYKSISIVVAVAIAALIVISPQPASAELGKLTSAAGIAFSATYPEHARRQVQAALQQEGCEFIDGLFVNAVSTLHFNGNARSLNKALKKLAECPATTVAVSFKKIEHKCDWRLTHDADSNRFQIIVNVNSKHVDIEELAIPPAKGPEFLEDDDKATADRNLDGNLSLEEFLDDDRDGAAKKGPGDGGEGLAAPKKLEGKATVEFHVGEVRTVNIDSLFVPDVSHAQVIKGKIPGAKIGEEVLVIVSREVATRLLKLGISDPAEHFRGKILRVSGTVKQIKRPSTPSVTVYRIQVTHLDQLESIRSRPRAGVDDDAQTGPPELEELSLELAQAMQRLNEAKAKLAHTDRLFQRGYVTRVEVDGQKLKVRKAKAEIRRRGGILSR